MKFLTWNNNADCQQSLEDINVAYGCPYVLSNGYKMDQWDVNTKSDVEERWGFYAPLDRPGATEAGVSADDLMLNLTGTPNIDANRPDDWMPED